MAAVKPKRHGPAMDMTAMCDVAFLLLTFFIMTTQFKSQETVSVTAPSSVSKDIIPESNVCTITIDKDGKYYFGITDPQERRNFINAFNTKFSLGLNATDQNAYTNIAEVGIPKDKLKNYLGLNPSDQKRVKIEGIPLDSVNAELTDWAITYVENIDSAKIAIRGDIASHYPAVKVIFKEFGKRKMTKFKLITKGEN